MAAQFFLACAPPPLKLVRLSEPVEGARTYLPLKDNLLVGAISQLSKKSQLGARRSKIANESGGAIMQSRTNDKTYSFVAFAIAFIFILVATLWINP